MKKNIFVSVILVALLSSFSMVVKAQETTPIALIKKIIKVKTGFNKFSFIFL